MDTYISWNKESTLCQHSKSRTSKLTADGNLPEFWIQYKIVSIWSIRENVLMNKFGQLLSPGIRDLPKEICSTLFLFGICINYFSCCSDRNNLRENGLTLAHYLWAQSIVVGKVWAAWLCGLWQEPAAAPPLPPPEAERNAGAQVASSFSFLSSLPHITI